MFVSRGRKVRGDGEYSPRFIFPLTSIRAPEHPSHTTEPQTRQWCFRFVNVNGSVQTVHCGRGCRRGNALRSVGVCVLEYFYKDKPCELRVVF